MGYSSVECETVGLNMKKVVPQCPYGTISGIADIDYTDDKVAGPAFGINPAKPGNTYKDACRRQNTFHGDSTFSNVECS